ncbi:MAG: EamA family transporter [Ignavibacterium album]|uniref:DMT family transporter n=1 Tax=Ignavibacterium album TaxID=591197 RepID=UPI0026EFB9ED|nr:EamA family transporter [Ignavibacterium album]MBI5662971.1 EamA family transporter [Ignavibacterium album]
MIKNVSKTQIFPASLVSIAATLWAVDGIVLRPYLYNLPVPLVVFIETTIVAIILSPFFYKQFPFLKNLKLKDWIAFLGVAFFGGALGTMAITRALFFVNYVNLSIVIFIQKLQPVFAIILAAIILKEKLTKEFLIWAATAIIGAYIITFEFNLPLLHTGDKTAVAALFALVAAFSFGFSTVLSKRALKNVGFQLGTYLRFALTAAIMLLTVVITNDFKSLSEISINQLYVFLIIAFSTGGPAIFIYYYGLKKISASVATICELAFPLSAVILEYFVHGKILTPVQWIGAMILLFSIIKVSGIEITSFFNNRNEQN